MSRTGCESGQRPEAMTVPSWSRQGWLRLNHELGDSAAAGVACVGGCGGWMGREGGWMGWVGGWGSDGCVGGDGLHGVGWCGRGDGPGKGGNGTGVRDLGRHWVGIAIGHVEHASGGRRGFHESSRWRRQAHCWGPLQLATCQQGQWGHRRQESSHRPCRTWAARADTTPAEPSVQAAANNGPAGPAYQGHSCQRELTGPMRVESSMSQEDSPAPPWSYTWAWRRAPWARCRGAGCR